MNGEDRCSVCGGVLSADETTEVCSDCREKQALESSGTPSNSQAGSAFAPTIRQPTGFVPPSPKMLGGHFTQIEVLELLGQGGMGAVYKARQIKLDRLVALKIVHLESAGDPAFRERFNREARTLARLNHPNIVAVHDFGEAAEASAARESESAPPFYYFVMEYVDGANLRRRMQNAPRPPETLAIVRQVCEALQYAHEEGVVHRDIKPENLLIDARGRVKIADFGLAKFMSRLPDEITLTGTHQVMGTPRYMAPEQLQGSRAVDHRADIYSLGVVIYELLTGELPLGRFAPPSKIAGVDPRWDEVVLRCLEQSPDRRYQQVGDILSDLVSLMDAENPPSRMKDRVPQEYQPPLGDSAIDPTEIVPSSHVVPPEIRHRVKWPGILLMINGFLGIFPVFGLLISGLVALRVHGESESPIPGLLYLIFAAVALILVGLVVRGGWHLVTLEHYRAALLASFLGQPAGIWALIVLSRPEVRSAFRQPSQPIGFLKVVFSPLPWMMLLASLGIWQTFQPWAAIANTLVSPIVWVNVAGFAWWQGMAACFGFGGILLMVAISAGFHPVPLWRPLGVGLVGLGILAATSHFIVELRNGTLPVQPLLEAASWGMSVEGKRPESINEAKVVAKIALGPYLMLAVSVGLFAFLTLDLRHAFQSKYEMDSSKGERPRAITFFRESE